MVFAPSPIGKKTLDEESLKKDYKSCRKFGPCGVGMLALYLGGRYLDRRHYVPWKEVKRVFKRVAMSQGGFTGKGMFGSMAFLVVQLGGGVEKECPFKFEADVDRLLACVEQEHPDIPTHSVKAQNKLQRRRPKKRRAISRSSRRTRTPQSGSSRRTAIFWRSAPRSVTRWSIPQSRSASLTISPRCTA